MGKGKKGKKGKKSKEKKEKIQLKKEKQILKSLRKERSKKKKELTNADTDALLDTLCASEAVENRYKHINISNTANNSFVECEKPNPRHHCSITFINDEEFLLFGGESKENKESITYNDLFKYNVVKNTWKYYFTVDKKPKPRTSHQAVYFQKKLYIFGGELSTDSHFFHFNDMWCFDLKSNKFEEILTNDKKDEKPSPRSGHKMILWKKCFLLFGGFFDNGKCTEYFNDLYLYVINSNKWINLTNIYKEQIFASVIGMNKEKDSEGQKGAKEKTNDKDSKWKKNNDNISSSNYSSNITANDNESTDGVFARTMALLRARFMKFFDFSSYMPCKRSNVALFTDIRFQNIYIYGGYAKVKSSLQVEVGEHYDDMWVINLQFPNEENISISCKKIKKSIFQPSKRVGFATYVHKNVLLLFGGVYDQITKLMKKGSDINEASIKESSLFFNDIYAFDMNSEHWSQLSVYNKNTDSSNRKGICSGIGKRNIKGREMVVEVKSGEKVEVEEVEEEEDLTDAYEFQKKREQYAMESDDYETEEDSEFDGERSTNELSRHRQTGSIFYFDEYGNKKAKILKDKGKMKKRKRMDEKNEKKEADVTFRYMDNNIIETETNKMERRAKYCKKEKVKEEIKDDKMDEEELDIEEEDDILLTKMAVTKDVEGENVAVEKCTSEGEGENEEERDKSLIVTDTNDAIIGTKQKKQEEKSSIIIDTKKLHEDDVNSFRKKEKEIKKEKKRDKKRKGNKQFMVSNFEEPIGRINCHIFFLNKHLYVFGGMYEYMNNPIVLGDFWKIDLDKREKWEIIDKGNIENVYVDELSGDDSDDDDDDDSLFDSSIESTSDSDIGKREKKGKIVKNKKNALTNSDSSNEDEEDDEESETEKEDEEDNGDDDGDGDRELERSIITEKIEKLKEKIEKENKGLLLTKEENLNDFFSRTRDYWVQEINTDEKDSKEIRKLAFNICREKYELLKKYFKRIEKLECFLQCHMDSEYEENSENTENTENAEEEESENNNIEDDN